MAGFGNKRKKKGKQTIISIKTTVDGIKFQSKLEAYTYNALKKAGIPLKYEEESFTLMQGFKAPVVVWANKYKTFKARESPVRAITYTPDFTCPDGHWIIECKGRANESFPLRWKLFLRCLKVNELACEVYMPSNYKDVTIMIESITKLLESK
jgi:hypothetical protein